MTAVGYTRLSQQSDTTIDRQKSHIKEYAVELGFELEKIYDDGERSSGFDTSGREDYQKLRERITSDPPDAVIVSDKRRLARDVDEVMRLVPDLRTDDVEMHTWADGRFDLDDAMRVAIDILQAAAAHEEKMEEIEKAIEAVEERQAAGYDHGRPRFGTEYDDGGEFQVPGDDFETIERIWELRDRGRSYSEIAEKTGVPRATAYRVVSDRDWYENRSADTSQKAQFSETAN